MTTDLAALLTSRIEHARQIVASTGSLDETIGTLAAELLADQNAHGVAAIALIQLAADEDYSGVAR